MVNILSDSETFFFHSSLTCNNNIEVQNEKIAEGRDINQKQAAVDGRKVSLEQAPMLAEGTYY